MRSIWQGFWGFWTKKFEATSHKIFLACQLFWDCITGNKAFINLHGTSKVSNSVLNVNFLTTKFLYQNGLTLTEFTQKCTNNLSKDYVRLDFIPFGIFKPYNALYLRKRWQLWPESFLSVMVKLVSKHWSAGLLLVKSFSANTSLPSPQRHRARLSQTNEQFGKIHTSCNFFAPTYANIVALHKKTFIIFLYSLHSVFKSDNIFPFDP